jgi:hypothetical protein
MPQAFGWRPNFTRPNGVSTSAQARRIAIESRRLLRPASGGVWLSVNAPAGTSGRRA